MFVLIMYDVATQRTEKFRKLLTKFLIHEQNSVFTGDLPESKLIQLRKDLSKLAVANDHIVEIIAENRNNVSISVLQKSGENGQLVAIAHNHHRQNSTVI